MSAEGDAVARWAAAHAATIPAQRPAAAPPAPVPAVLMAFTKVRSWEAIGLNYCVAWGRQPDGSLVLATGTARGIGVAIWDTDTGELLRGIPTGGEGVQAVAWGRGPDGRQVLGAARTDGTAVIMDMDAPGGVILRELTRRTGSRVAWGQRPDGRLLLAVAGPDDVGMWDPYDDESSFSGLPGLPGRYFAWGNLADGRSVLAIGDRRSVLIVDPGTGKTLNRLAGIPGWDRERKTWAFSWGRRPDGHAVLAVGRERPDRYSDNSVIWVWHENGGESGVKVFGSAMEVVYGLSWAPPVGGRMLLAAATLVGVMVWDGHTGRLLHTERFPFRDASNARLDWTVAPDGRLLLAAAAGDGMLHIWEAVLDPPVTPPAAPGDPERTPAHRTGVILDPPEDVTPPFASGSAIHIDVFAAPDGRLLLAAPTSPKPEADGPAHIWDLCTGQLLATLVSPGGHLNSVAWGCPPGGRPFIALGGGAGSLSIHDADSGQLIRNLAERSPSLPPVVHIACGNQTDGQTLLATGHHFDATARIWDPDTAEIRCTIQHADPGQSGGIAVAWAHLPDGQLVLATSGGPVKIWSDTGELLLTLDSPASGEAVAWGWRDGKLLLAAACKDHAVRVWDGVTGELLRTLPGRGEAFSVAFGNSPDGRLLLAAAGLESGAATARIWDLETGQDIAAVPGPWASESVAWATAATGDLMLVASSDERQSGGPARVWRIAAGRDVPASPDAATGSGATRYRTGELTEWLLRLGGAGLWLPAGLIADLVELTGPDASCRMEALRAEPGVARLRDLDWPPAARVAFAALLASDLAIPDRYAAPSDVSAQTLHTALTRSFDGGHGNGWTPQVPVVDLRTAAAHVTDRTVTLLRILGPAACAADPLLPVRLAHRIPQLPALSSRELRLLAAATGRPADGTAKTTGTVAYAPGTAGLARTGPLTRLLPTQLALPRDLMTMRLAENQLLYRQHRAPAPPAPQPVTIILDTTPPTFGPAGHVLRLAAHLIAMVLWEHGHCPRLITLTDPDMAAELRSPADLVALWASSTLSQPAPALRAALATATAFGEPVVFCTHHHTARQTYAVGPAARLLTAHHTPERPPPTPSSPWHCHLAPNPTQAQLGLAITRLLATNAADGNLRQCRPKTRSASGHRCMPPGCAPPP